LVAIVQVQELIDAGVHFGHRSSRWNPKMRPYIYGKRNLVHIIDLRETVRGMVRASRFLTRVASEGSLVLYVGTKRQAQDAIKAEATRCHMPYVCERWIGGTFTNFRIVRSRLQRLEELERLIATGEINTYSKKRRATLLRELRKVRRNLSGLRTMNRLPGAMVVVDPKRESSAVKEARTSGIPTVALIDTDSDPDTIDLAVPGNDDSLRSIELYLRRMADAVLQGLVALPRDQVEKLEKEYAKAHEPTLVESSAPVGEAADAAAPSHPVSDASVTAPDSSIPTADSADRQIVSA
jgi:small subunit ribosomal protein S2